MAIQNGAEAIIVHYSHVTNMQPAYDLKPITQYKTNVAKLSDGVVKETLMRRECAVIKTNEPATIE